MEHHDEPLRDRLIDEQWPPPEKLARYREDVDGLVKQLRRRKWWADAVRTTLTTLGAIVLFPLTVLFGLMFLYVLVGSNRSAAWVPGTAGLLCLAGRSRWCDGSSGGARTTCCWKSSGYRPRGSSSTSKCGVGIAAEVVAKHETYRKSTSFRRSTLLPRSHSTHDYDQFGHARTHLRGLGPCLGRVPCRRRERAVAGRPPANLGS